MRLTSKTVCHPSVAQSLRPTPTLRRCHLRSTTAPPPGRPARHVRRRRPRALPAGGARPLASVRSTLTAPAPCWLDRGCVPRSPASVPPPSPPSQGASAADGVGIWAGMGVGGGVGCWSVSDACCLPRSCGLVCLLACLWGFGFFFFSEEARLAHKMQSNLNFGAMM